MGQKLFAFATVTALTGLVAAVNVVGCSSSSTNDNPTDAGRDVHTIVPVGDGASDTDAGACPLDTVDMNQDPAVSKYTTALSAPGSCTTDELKALETYINNANDQLTLDGMKAALSTKCQGCVFSDIGAAAWAPFVLDGDQLIINGGGCVDLVSGKKAGVGQAAQAFFDCRLLACASCSTSDEYASCLQSNALYEGGVCQGTVNDYITAAGSQTDAQNWLKACTAGTYTFDAPITVQCISGVPVTGDGGVDGGDGGDGGDDAGDDAGAP